jgi:phage tail sheath gpL-like
MAVNVRKRSQAERLLADCIAADAAGDMVRISADEVAGVKQVAKIDITAAAPTHLPVGMIITKLSTTRCVVQVAGEIIGVYSGLTPGLPLFINAASRLTHSVPTHPGSGVKSVHHAAQALSSTSLFLRIQQPSIIR